MARETDGSARGGGFELGDGGVEALAGGGEFRVEGAEFFVAGGEGGLPGFELFAGGGGFGLEGGGLRVLFRQREDGGPGGFPGGFDGFLEDRDVALEGGGAGGFGGGLVLGAVELGFEFQQGFIEGAFLLPLQEDQAGEGEAADGVENGKGFHASGIGGFSTRS